VTVGTEDAQAHALRPKALRNGGGMPSCLHCGHKPNKKNKAKTGTADILEWIHGKFLP